MERATLWTRFTAYIANLWARVYRGLKFDGFNLTVNQVAVVFPFLLQAPRFFSGAIKLGDVIQTSQALRAGAGFAVVLPQFVRHLRAVPRHAGPA